MLSQKIRQKVPILVLGWTTETKRKPVHTMSLYKDLREALFLGYVFSHILFVHYTTYSRRRRRRRFLYCRLLIILLLLEFHIAECRFH